MRFEDYIILIAMHIFDFIADIIYKFEKLYKKYLYESNR